MAKTTKTAAATEPKIDDTTPDDPKDIYADKIKVVGDRTIVVFRDEKFSFPTARAKWPTRAFQAFQKQQHADGVELVLGPRQWARFNQVAPTIADFWEFLPLFASAAGFVQLDK